jgi:hypothetical protein
MDLERQTGAPAKAPRPALHSEDDWVVRGRFPHFWSIRLTVFRLHDLSVMMKDEPTI